MGLKASGNIPHVFFRFEKFCGCLYSRRHIELLLCARKIMNHIRISFEKLKMRTQEKDENQKHTETEQLKEYPQITHVNRRRRCKGEICGVAAVANPSNHYRGNFLSACSRPPYLVSWA
ncbi:hypothetical protein EVAR_31232_1 [Eumeta japonica]|uniref:Uncharacterized protein n=1 Tax=Eumeta variegata TaxID=151549 RepID=A0A4C1W1H2_EUMVA|nr:hypothetical protein EVAR_31232_1 [Eumeta japonica]